MDIHKWRRKERKEWKEGKKINLPFTLFEFIMVVTNIGIITSIWITFILTYIIIN